MNDNPLIQNDPDDYETALRINRLISGAPDDLSPPPEKPTKSEPLKGCYFHSIKNDKLLWQGVILRHVGSDYVLALTFSWLDGSAYCRLLLKISDLAWDEQTKTGFYLYGDHWSFWISNKEGAANALRTKTQKLVP